jgi:hypothetical protein
MATVINEVLHPDAFLVEYDHDLSFEQVTVDQNQTIVAGQVLGRTAAASGPAVASTANAGNTGNGALTLASPAYGGEAKEGVYKVAFTDATHFLVEGPDGVELGEGVAGTAFTAGNAVKFTIAAGGTAFVAGDGFLVTVTMDLTEYRYVALAPTAVDGSEIAAGIARFPVTTGAGQTAKLAVVDTHASVRLADLTFAAGITTAQQDLAVEQLRRRQIKLR